MRYIRTKDGKLFDIEKIKQQIKSDGYSKKYRFGRLIVNKTLQELQLKWTCYDGNNDLCHFGIRLNCDSIEYKQANTIEELIIPGDLVEIDGYVMEVADSFWSKDKTIGIARPKDCDDTRIYSYDINSIRKLYIPNGNDYKLVAIHHNSKFDSLETIKEKGEWELL